MSKKSVGIDDIKNGIGIESQKVCKQIRDQINSPILTESGLLLVLAVKMYI